MSHATAPLSADPLLDDHDGDHDDERFAAPREFGCCYPDRCCMPGLHFESECHTAEDMEEAMKDEAA